MAELGKLFEGQRRGKTNRKKKGFLGWVWGKNVFEMGGGD